MYVYIIHPICPINKNNKKHKTVLGPYEEIQHFHQVAGVFKDVRRA